jgi:hypothetical protein
MASGSKTIEKTSTAEKTPWGPQVPGYLDIYKRVTDALGKTNNNPFMGDFIAQPGRDANMGINMLRNVAQGPAGDALTRGSTDYLKMAADTAKGIYLDPAKNPFINPVVEAAQRPVTQNFQNTVIPGIQDQSIMQGAYGGSGHGVAMGTASEGYMRQLGDISSNIFYQNYLNERNNQINAPTMMGQGFDIARLPGQAMLDVDAQRRQLAQLGLDNARQKWSAQQTAPWFGLGEAANILSTGGFGNTSGRSVEPNPNYVDPFTNALKIALGAGSTVAGMGGSGGFGWWGKGA